MIKLDVQKVEWIIELLEIASGRFSDFVCNDFLIEDIPENRVLIKEIYGISSDSRIDDLFVVDDNKICMEDYFLMEYLAEYLGDKINETKEICNNRS